MVTVNFKLISTSVVQLEVNGPETFENILKRCAAEANFDLADVVAVRKNMKLAKTDLVQDLDEIDVFPALSGG